VKSKVGHTPHQQIAHLIFKQEYLLPSGSVKDRGISYQLAQIHRRGITRVVISSSGNAAISAAYYCKKYHLDLAVFVSPKINPSKLNHLKDFPVTIKITPRPISSAFRFSQSHHARLLRPSKDPDGPIGYQSLGKELAPLKPAAIFFPVSSGTTLSGTFDGYRQNSDKLPQFHLVQTPACHPLAQKFDHNFTSAKSSLADALVAKSVPRKSQILNIINQTHGWGWVVSNHQIRKANRWLTQHHLICSFEGAATLAAVWKAQKNGRSWPEPVVCLLTGKKYDNVNPETG
jgi:threonine synthase